MDSGRNFVGSFGNPYYRSADYRTRYPAYLRSVAPPPPMTVNVQDMLFPKQFALQKVTFTSTTVEKPSIEEYPVVKKSDGLKNTKTKRKLSRKQRRPRSEIPPQEDNPINDSSIPLMVSDEIDKVESKNPLDRISLPATEDDHTHQYLSDSIPVPVLPSAVEPLNHTGSIPTYSYPPAPPPPLPTESEEYYSDQHIFPLPPPPIPEVEEDYEHQNLLPSPNHPPPQQPFQSTINRLSDTDNNESLHPIEQCKRMAKRFQRECRRRQVTALQNEKYEARTKAEEAKHFLMTTGDGWSKENDYNREKTSDDKIVVRQGWQKQQSKESEYAEIERS